MQKFIKKTIFFSIGILIFTIVLFYSLQIYYNHPFSDKNAIFVWGDSQTYQGIDIEELSNITKKNVYSSAFHGAGIYDFLLFTERVSTNSEVIVSISKLVQIRRKEKDFNRSGLSFWSLKQLYDNNYSKEEIIAIFKLNLKPKKNIFKTTNLYPYKDSMEVVQDLAHFKSYYQNTPPFLNDKQSLYLIGVENLINKNCKISFLEFPFHQDLKNIEKQSPAYQKIEALKNDIAFLFSEFQTDTLDINKGKNIFKDLSHLNCKGAKDLSEKLGIKMSKHESTTLYIAH